MANFSFTPTTGLQDISAYPTNPGTEAAAREQIQRGLNQIKDYINNDILSQFTDIKKVNEAMHVPCIALISGNIIIVDLGQQLTTGNYLININFNHNPSGSPSYISSFTGIIQYRIGYGGQVCDILTYNHISKDVGYGTTNLADLKMCWATSNTEVKNIGVMSSAHIQITKGSPNTNISDFQFKINCVKLNNL